MDVVYTQAELVIIDSYKAVLCIAEAFAFSKVCVHHTVVFRAELVALIEG
jgi:hypothetical protein